MRPIESQYANPALALGEFEEVCPRGVITISNVPVWTDGMQCVSCWQMSWRERLRALLFGRVWISVFSGSSQPPLYAEVAREYLEILSKE